MLPLPFKVGAVLLLAAASASAPNEQEGAPRIGNIEIVSGNVFHEAENDDGLWVYRFANKLHVQTREDIIRQELLFASGDTLDPKILAETERNLRNLIFIRDAKIETIPGDKGTVDVRVQEHRPGAFVRESWKRAHLGSGSLREEPPRSGQAARVYIPSRAAAR